MPGEQLQLFFNLSLDMLCVCRSDGYFVRVNPAFTRILGHTEEELLSRPYGDFVHPEDRSVTEEATRDIAAGQRIEYFENRYRHKDGTYRWVAWTASAAVVKDGFFYAVARDITEQKEQARAREDLVRRLEASLQQIRTLEGLLPICSWCHCIRDEAGDWNKLERYIARRTHAEFTHAICPTCLADNFPGKERGASLS